MRSEEMDLARRAVLWVTYLQMLSVEKTEPFFAELDIRIEREKYSEVKRFARACLEVFMFPSISRRVGKPDSRSLTRYWSSYRKKEGVLTDRELIRFAAADRALEPKGWYGYILKDLSSELQDWIGPVAAQVLEDWFEHNYLPTRSGFQMWYLAIWRLLKDKSHNLNPEETTPFSHVEWRSLKAFCDRYETGRSDIERISRSSEALGVTAWEAVLQTFPIDGRAGNYFPWLDHGIKPCLLLRVFRTEWRELRRSLGSEAMARLMDWAALRFGQELPGESAFMNE